MGDNDNANALEGDEPQAPVAVWIGLIALSALSFWAQAVVTEERFVPSLNVIATRFRIPDDVAGATLMATGASAPELFASIVALFVTHSSLGLGTIIGSEIFNHLIICAGSILAARNHRLKLDRMVLLREVSFYALALVFLLIALSDRRPVDDDEGFNHIFISLWDGALLVGGYVAYVLVCANYDRLLSYFRIKKQGSLDAAPLPSIPAKEWNDESSPQETIVVPAMPFIRQLSREPSSNFHTLDERATVAQLYRASASQSSADEKDVETEPGIHRRTPCYFAVNRNQPKPSSIYGLDEIVRNENGDVSCFLWQRSSFYSKARVAINAWQLRFFTFRQDQTVSVPDRTYQTHVARYPFCSKIEVCERTLLLKLHPTGNGNEKIFTLMAPTIEILQTVVEAFRCVIRETSVDGSFELADSSDVESSFVQAEQGVSLISYPFGASLLQQSLHILLLPLKLLMHVTIPDARRVAPQNMEPSLPCAFCGIVSCVCWIIVGSYFMVTSLERLGELMQIPNSVIGITVSAAGTSLPNYVASQVAARQGLGNMAVSNAFGSNIFNILIGLGLPWTLYCGLLLRGGEYGDLRDDEITESVFILAGVLVLFVLLLFWTNFVLSRWHAYSFIAMYVLYLVYAIGQVYV